MQSLSNFWEVAWWSFYKPIQKFYEMWISQSSPDILEEEGRKAYSTRNQEVPFLTVMLYNSISIRVGKLEQDSKRENRRTCTNKHAHVICQRWQAGGLVTQSTVSPRFKLHETWYLIMISLPLQSIPRVATLGWLQHIFVLETSQISNRRAIKSYRYL